MTTQSTQRLPGRQSNAETAKRTATVIVPTITPARAEALLASLAGSGGDFETIVVDNGTGAPELDRAAAALEGAEVLRLAENQGYSRAVNQAARRAEGEVLVLLNDDSEVEPGYVERITEPIDPGGGVLMVSGVMRDAAVPGLIETAGIELDRSLMAFDYLNGEPMERLDGPVGDPIGPSGAAGAFERAAFLEVGGFDESLFAYLEDVDLVLRLRRAGATCRLARTARGTHEHSTTLGSGSRRKDYLMGYGRGYMLRKWGVVSPKRLPRIVLSEVLVNSGQAILDRNLGGIRGRVQGFRAARPTEQYPSPSMLPAPTSFLRTLVRRWRRRSRQRQAPS
jgi:N-acetylglucosaminyl-diphospho-decaprenol L-rhamnosyltransferase